MRRLMCIALVLTGCRKIEPAPKELDDLLHYLWTNVEQGDDATLAEGIVNLDAAVKAKSLEGPEDGTLTTLTKAEAALVGVTDRDPKDAPGVYLVNAYSCDLDTLQAILTHADQAAIYPGVYDAYSRSYDSPKEPFLAGEVDGLEWDLEYTASILGATYVARPRGRLRRVPDLSAEETPWGPVVFARTHMPEPAEFDTDNKSQEQDYQLEMYWERSPGTIVHVYGLWRQADFGAGYTSEDTGVQRILLNNLIDWDDTTEALCAEGGP